MGPSGPVALLLREGDHWKDIVGNVELHLEVTEEDE